MPTYHRSQRLRLVGTGPKVEQLQEGRFRLTFTCTATNPNEAWMNGNKDQIMTDYGTLQSAQKNIAGIDPRTDEAYSDMVLFKTEANPSQRDLIITLVYETATGSFVKAKDDKVLLTPNGRQRVERMTIAKTGTSLPSVTVGTTSITVNSIACVLASRNVEENDAFLLITEIYIEPGESSRSERTGPMNMPGTEQVTIVSSGSTAVELTTTDDIKLISKQQQNNNGFSTFVRSYIKGNNASSTTNSYTSGRTYQINSNGDYSSVGGPNPGVIGDYFQATGSATLGSGVTAYLVGQITGTKLTYDNIVQVNVPGTVQCKRYEARGDIASLSGGGDKHQAYIKTVPPNRIKIKATVTESIETSIPTISTLAYNLDGISCSVTRVSTSLSETAGPTASTTSSSNNITSSTGFSRSASLSTSNSYFPGSYLLDGDLGYFTTSMIQGKQYRIITLGSNLSNSQWQTLGASSSPTVGEVFKYSGTAVSGVDQTDTLVRDFGMEANFDYQSSATPKSSGNVIGTDTGQSDTEMSLITDGATASTTSGDPPTSYSTTGTIQQKARPVLTTIDGTTYFEVIKFSKS